jgi:hypothetical protein
LPNPIAEPVLFVPGPVKREASVAAGGDTVAVDFAF